MADTVRTPQSVRLFVACVFAAGAAAFTSAFFVTPSDDWPGLCLIVAMTGLCDWLSVRLYFDGRVSVSFVVHVFAVLSFGAEGGALVATTTAITWYLFAERSRTKLLFNFGQLNVAVFLGSALALWAGLSSPGEDVLLALGAGVLVALVLFSVTSAAVATVMSLSTRRSLRSTYTANFAWLFPHYAALGLVGGGMALAYSRLGIAGVIVLSLPLLLSRYSIKQVVDKTRDNVLRLERSNEQLQASYVEIRSMSDDLEKAYTGTLESLVAALDVRDRETRGHSSRVATHSVDIANMLGIKEEQELGTIYRGALMHDVGKIGVPDAILLKPDKLTAEEWEFMRRHPAMGYRILAQVPYLRPTAKIVLAHHERWDGGGYPRRLKGEDIPLGARIFAICDTYDAIISDRPYRQGQSPDAAMQEILRCAGTQFDPKVAEAFEAAFPRWREEQHGANIRPLYLPAWQRKDDETGRAAG